MRRSSALRSRQKKRLPSVPEEDEDEEETYFDAISSTDRPTISLKVPQQSDYDDERLTNSATLLPSTSVYNTPMRSCGTPLRRWRRQAWINRTTKPDVNEQTNDTTVSQDPEEDKSYEDAPTREASPEGSEDEEEIKCSDESSDKGGANDQGDPDYKEHPESSSNCKGGHRSSPDEKGGHEHSLPDTENDEKDLTNDSDNVTIDQLQDHNSVVAPAEPGTSLTRGDLSSVTTSSVPDNNQVYSFVHDDQQNTLEGASSVQYGMLELELDPNSSLPQDVKVDFYPSAEPGFKGLRVRSL